MTYLFDVMPWLQVFRALSDPLDIFCVSHTCSKFREIAMKASTRGGYKLKEESEKALDLLRKSTKVINAKKGRRRKYGIRARYKHIVGSFEDVMPPPSLLPLTPSSMYKAYNTVVMAILFRGKLDTVKEHVGYEIPDDCWYVMVPEFATAIVLANKRLKSINADIHRCKREMRSIVSQDEIRDATARLQHLVLDLEQTLFHVQHRLFPIIRYTPVDPFPFDYDCWLQASAKVQTQNVEDHPRIMKTAMESKIPPSMATQRGRRLRRFMRKQNNRVTALLGIYTYSSPRHYPSPLLC